MDASTAKNVVIIGAGPAGLTAAYELSKEGIPSIVLEKDDVVGGLARTVTYKGYHFDIGGHRFFTKVKAVEEMWHEVLAEDFLHRSRLSRIYYNKKFFYYPLRAWNALSGLGPWNSLLILASYVNARLRSVKEHETFEEWVSHHFGKRLYRIFFKTYTEKVWGIPCNEIRAEWAAQRIKGLSLTTVIKNVLLKNQGKEVKTLIDAFDYPRLGPGMMWQRVRDLVSQTGSKICFGADVDSVIWNKDRVEAVTIKKDGNRTNVSGTDFISTMPVRELIQKLQPRPPEEVLTAANGLNYRDFVTIALIVNQKEVFPDNWIYIHDPQVKVGRIQNFKNWSPDMVPDPNKTCLGLEYFCFEGDELWTSSDQDLISLARRELQMLGLVQADRVEDGVVVRMPKAYPVYDSTYQERLRIVRNFLEGMENLHLVGRNGMHKYNNQDHSMLTAMLAVKNILGGKYDLWAVNADPEYHEELRADTTRPEYALLASTQPSVPGRVAEGAIDRAILRGLARLDKLALATAIGTVAALALFVASMFLVIKGGPFVGRNLSLLGQYFFGYTVSVKGAFIGMIYMFVWGFIFGWLFAYLRNLSVGLFIYFVKQKAEATSFRNFLDYL